MKAQVARMSHMVTGIVVTSIVIHLGSVVAMNRTAEVSFVLDRRGLEREE
jgi:hypothetical protein